MIKAWLGAAAAASLIGVGAQAAELPGTVWATQNGDSHVQFEVDETGALVGRFIWLRAEDEDGVTVFDDNNPDEELRARPLMGLALVYGFEQKGEKWVKGNIYNPRDGKTYRSSIEPLEDGTLGVKGCVARVLCQTQVWTPVEATEEAAVAADGSDAG
ncbi:MAG: DUF2147 domain-containing protein [Caulobacterales bacterium]|nr:DUF2147 domain-containing protein [Caulobacterales bacterium]